MPSHFHSSRHVKCCRNSHVKKINSFNSFSARTYDAHCLASSSVIFIFEMLLSWQLYNDIRTAVEFINTQANIKALNILLIVYMSTFTYRSFSFLFFFCTFYAALIGYAFGCHYYPNLNSLGHCIIVCTPRKDFGRSGTRTPLETIHG